MKIILQNNEEDCLLACYTMLLNDLGINIPLYEVYTKDSLPADGLNLSYLLTLNNRFNVFIKGFHADFDNLYKIYKESRRRMILHWNQDHFVVAEKIMTDRVIIVDPAIGRVQYSREEFLSHYSGTLVLVGKNDNFQRMKCKPIFWKYFKQTLNVKPIILFVISLLFVQLSVLLFSVTIRQMTSKEYVYCSSLFLLGSVIIFQILGFFIKNSALDKYNSDFDVFYSKSLFQKLLEKPLLYFRNHLSGEISEKINFKSSLRDSVTLKIIPSCVSFISGIAIFFYLMTISVNLTFILVGIISIYGIISATIYLKQIEYNQTYLQYLIDFNSEFQLDIDDIDYIKIMRREEVVFNSWMTNNKKVTEKYSNIIKIESLSQLIGTIFNYLSLSSIIIISIYCKDYVKISFSDLLVYQTSISLLISAIEQIKNAIFEVVRLGIYAEKQSDLLKDSKPIIVPNTNLDEYLIKAENLNFTYDIQPIYKDINLTIHKGEKIAILGRSGSGKTTLLMLLAGVLRYSGSLKYGVENFEKYLSIVLQNMTLRKGSILDNLEWSSDNLSPLYKVLEDTSADKIINNMPNKIYSKILKQGKNLSGGQIQKILIAKSLLKKEAIIFWDEVFSNLDEESKKKIYKNVLQSSYYSDETMLIVSHHLDIVDYVDYVIFIDDTTGEVIKDSHSNLLKTNRRYSEFINSKKLS